MMQGPDVDRQAGVEQLNESQGEELRWYQKMAGLLVVIFCFELGVFLLIFPWATEWHLNYFSSLPPWSRQTWNSPYFRGAISGLGIVNIYISLLEVFRL
ncbi:MAG: hypothetical protein ACRD7E_28345, partial [Bryobacteraceae bacterium]